MSTKCCWWVMGQGCLRTAELGTGIVRAVFVSCKSNVNLGCQQLSQKRGLGPPLWMVGKRKQRRELPVHAWAATSMISEGQIP